MNNKIAWIPDQVRNDEERHPEECRPEPRHLEECHPELVSGSTSSTGSNSESNAEIAIKVENLTKTYKLYDSPADRLKEALHWRGKKYHKDFHALNNVSFEIKKGETVGIVGKNGAGKSTLLKIITGVLSPTSGKVTVNGRVSALLELGAGFNPEYTGMENIYFQGNLMGYSNEEMADKVDAIVEFADIGDFINQPVKSYSSGMFARLAFAVAINVEPDILIVDEALSVGDAAFQNKCYNRFRKFRESGKTILFVSHMMDSIKMYCESALLLDHGAILNWGTPKDIIDIYLKLLRIPMIQPAHTPKNDLLLKMNSTSDSLYKIESAPWYNKNELRYGTGQVIFDSINMYDMNQEEYISGIPINNDLHIYLKIYAFEDIPIAYCGFGFRNIKGEDIYGFNGTPEYEHFSLGELKKDKFYMLKIIKKMNFIPGEYTFSPAIVIPSSNVGEGESYVHLDIRYNVLIIKILGDGRRYTGIVVDEECKVSFSMSS